MFSIAKTHFQEFSRNNKLLILTFIFVMLSGAVRKWGVDSSVISNFILLLQLTLPFTISFLLEKNTNTKEKFNKEFVLFYMLWLIVCVLNINNYTYFHGSLGFLIHSGFIIYMYSYFNAKERIDLTKTHTYLIIFSLLQIVLATVQYSLPNTHWLNVYASKEADVDAFVGTSVRVTGTFSYVSGFGSFIIFYTFLMCVLIKKNFNNYILTALILSGGLAALMNGSRSIILFYGLALITYLVSTKSSKKALIVASIIVLGTIQFINKTFSDPLQISEKTEEIVENFEERIDPEKTTEDQQARVVGGITEILNVDIKNELIGNGLGLTYQGANAAFGTSPYVQTLSIEGELVRLIVEGGYILLILKTIILLLILSHLNYPLLFKFFLFVSINLTIPIVFNIYNAFFLFFGMILLDNLKEESSK